MVFDVNKKLFGSSHWSDLSLSLVQAQVRSNAFSNTEMPCSFAVSVHSHISLMFFL